MKLVRYSAGKPTGILLFGFVFICLCKRSGSDWVLLPDCELVIFSDGKAIHFYGVYLQTGCWGGNIMWRSKKCLELQYDIT